MGVYVCCHRQQVGEGLLHFVLFNLLRPPNKGGVVNHPHFHADSICSMNRESPKVIEQLADQDMDTHKLN